MIPGFIEYNEAIRQKYVENNLRHLSMVDFDGKNTNLYLSDVLRRKKSIFPIPYSDFKIHDELDFITKDLLYITGTLYLLRPYIIDTRRTGGRYLQNHYDHRYLTYANFGLQTTYNFWDRLGDLLHLYIYTGLPENNVYFGRVLNNLDSNYKGFDEYVELKAIYDNQLKDILDERHKAVHHYQLECHYFWGTLEHSKNFPELDQLNEEKFSWPERMKDFLELCFRGFDLTLKLIDRLPDTVYSFILNSNPGPTPNTFTVQKLQSGDLSLPDFDGIDPNKVYSNIETLEVDIANTIGTPPHRIKVISN